jgi:2-C-methyl-D-erythritol 4-phosphate cytidylyltransferase
MGGHVPKQFLEVCGRPVLMYTLEVFARYDSSMPIVLVLPSHGISLWKEACKKHNFGLAHEIVEGGSTRFNSVKNGLAGLPPSGLVAIHDGVRPFVNVEVIARGFAVAAEKGNAIVSLPLKESIREMASSPAGSSEARDRGRYRLVQTPQTFTLESIKKAYDCDESPLFTDDASVAEAAGEKIHLIDGNEENIKITHPADLLLAEALIKNKKSPI